MAKKRSPERESWWRGTSQETAGGLIGSFLERHVVAVISGSVGASAFAAYRWLDHVRSWTNGLLVDVSVFLTTRATLEVPGWVLAILVLLWIWAARAFLLGIPKAFAEGITSWETYTTDIYDGVRWRWTADMSASRPPQAFCPRDDMDLVQDYGGFPRMTLRCDHCNERFPLSAPRSAPFDEYLLRFMREIDRRWRSGDWRKYRDNDMDRTDQAKKAVKPVS